jgi:protein associated with RNAse G/E
MRNQREKAVDKNMLEANIKLMDENKELKEKIKQSIKLIEQYLEKDLSLLDINKLLEILRSSVE